MPADAFTNMCASLPASIPLLPRSYMRAVNWDNFGKVLWCCFTSASVKVHVPPYISMTRTRKVSESR